jgi:hypothetical protein
MKSERSNNPAHAECLAIWEKTEDCLLFLRIKKLISEGEVANVRRRLYLQDKKKRMAAMPNAKLSHGGEEKL